MLNQDPTSATGADGGGGCMTESAPAFQQPIPPVVMPGAGPVKPAADAVGHGVTLSTSDFRGSNAGWHSRGTDNASTPPPMGWGTASGSGSTPLPAPILPPEREEDDPDLYDIVRWLSGEENL